MEKGCESGTSPAAYPTLDICSESGLLKTCVSAASQGQMIKMEAAIDTQESKIGEVFFFSACYDRQVTRYLGPIARGRAGPRFINTTLLIAGDRFVP